MRNYFQGLIGVVERYRKSTVANAVHEEDREAEGRENTRMIACSRQSADLARTEAHLPVIRSETARCFADPCIVTSLVYFIVPHSASIVGRLCTPTNTKVLRHCARLRIYECTRIPPFLITDFPAPFFEILFSVSLIVCAGILRETFPLFFLFTLFQLVDFYSRSFHRRTSWF